MNDRLAESQKYWDGFAASDPLWAVLAFPEKSDGRWTVSEFMKTGEREIALLFHRFAELQLPAANAAAASTSDAALAGSRRRWRAA